MFKGLKIEDDETSQTKEVFIPNKEIIGEFETAMSVSGWAEAGKIMEEKE